MDNFQMRLAGSTFRSKPIGNMLSSLQQFFTRNRGLVIFFFVVPASFFYQCIQNIRNGYYRRFRNTSRLHDQKVESIRQMVREGARSGMRMCTARKPWMTMSSRKATFKEDLLQIPIDLKNILEFDPGKEIIRLEPMVTMGDVTHFLVPKGYALAVQVEMDDLTVGGLCMGVGIETTSHRYGFLFETVEAYEIVTGDGRLIRASRQENADLFHSLPWSHGTLGFLVAVELKVIPVKKYMRLEYLPFHSQEEFCRTFQELAESKTPPSYLEALVFSPESGVIMCGEMADVLTDEQRKRIQPINRWHKPWFYTHVARFLETGPGEEFIPLRHYFHRHTPSVFFQLKDLIPFANQAWYRWLFAWMGAPKIKLMKYSMTPQLRERAFKNRVAQDILVPVADLEESLDYAHPVFEIYPLWICPVRLFNHSPYEGFLRNPKGPSEMYVDIGIYGIPKAVARNTWNGIREGRALEAFTQAKRGYHMLYADIFMNAQEFEAMFEHELYRATREKYGASKRFPEVFDKIRPESWLIETLEKEQPDREKQEKVLQS